jgi:hypothetical protein
MVIGEPTGRQVSGAEWRQYESIFPALATSRIDQVSVEYAGAKVLRESYREV